MEEINAFAHSLADGLKPGNILPGAAPKMIFHRRKTSGHRRLRIFHRRFNGRSAKVIISWATGAGAAQQRINWQPSHLAGNIPETVVKRAKPAGATEHGARGSIELGVEPFAIQWIFANGENT